MDSFANISVNITHAHSEPTDLEPVVDVGEIEMEFAQAAFFANPSLAYTEPTDVETITVPTDTESESAESQPS